MQTVRTPDDRFENLPDYPFASNDVEIDDTDHLDLTGATFFGQDWGGLVGLRLVAENPDRFAQVIIGNTGLPTGETPPSEAPTSRSGDLSNRSTEAWTSS